LIYYPNYGQFPKYVTVKEKKAESAKDLAKLRKKDPAIKPVILFNGKLATSWCGKAWNRNLESYSDRSANWSKVVSLRSFQVYSPPA